MLARYLCHACIITCLENKTKRHWTPELIYIHTGLTVSLVDAKLISFVEELIEELPQKPHRHQADKIIPRLANLSQFNFHAAMKLICGPCRVTPFFANGTFDAVRGRNCRVCILCNECTFDYTIFGG